MQFGMLFVVGEMMLFMSSIQADVPAGYLGCYEDGKYDRVLSGYGYLNMYINGAIYCKELCKDRGYRYAGTEYTDECFCGNEIRWKTASLFCTYRCKRNRGEFCGGSEAISIYDTWQCVTKPCQNGGNCSDIDVNSYRCSCSEQWTGRNCEEVVTTTPRTTSTTTSITAASTTIITTLPDTNTTSNISSTYTFTGTADEMNIVTYIAVICGGLAVVVILLSVIYFLWRKQKKINENNKEILQNLEAPNSTANAVENGLSVIGTGTASNRSTLYCNEHVMMTSDGEHVNIEFHANQSNTNSDDDYNTLCLRGRNVDSLTSNGLLGMKNSVDSTYSRLGDHENHKDPTDTYSRLTYNKPNKRSYLCDSTYSHTRLESTQSEAAENTTPLNCTYNTLNTLPRTKVKRRNYSNFSNVMSENEDQIYGNVKNAEQVGIKENECLQSEKSEGEHVELKKDESENNFMTEDNIYAKAFKKSNNLQNCEKSEDTQQLTETDLPRCRVLEMLDETIEENYCDNEEEPCYYNVCSSNHDD